ncbi:MAG: hypothetical protein WC223_12960 [Bacteroidales bacterium]
MRKILFSEYNYVFFHIFFLAALYCLFYFTGIINIFPSEINICRWDCGWYKIIKDIGYYYKEAEQSSVAFFPAFPFLWSFLNVNASTMAIINASIFFISFVFIAMEFNIKKEDGLIFLSLPSIIFMFVPFSEALFFLFGSVLLIGLNRNNIVLASIGLFFCCLTRSAAVLFVPAIIFIEFIYFDGKKDLSKSIKNIITYGIIMFVANMAVILYQWNVTGVWFAFKKSQAQWNHYFHLLKFPLTSIGYNALWLDIIALWIGIFAGIYCLYIVIKKIKLQNYIKNKAFLFSVCYLFATAVFVLTYQGERLQSLNRYSFSTPFFLVFFIFINRNALFEFKKMLLILFYTIIILLLFNPFMPIFELSKIQTLVFYIAVYIYIILFVAYIFFNKNKYFKKLYLPLYFINVILQVLAFSFFINSQWIG